MKVFIIENGISKDIFVVRNKGRFCEKNKLTPRLLDYTIKGASATRYQEYHKNYRIVDKLEFIEAKDGDRVLWDSGVTGYCVREDGKHFKDKPVDRSVELENENELLQKELAKALKQKQKLQDQLNLNRKLIRDGNRHENMCDTILDACKEFISLTLPKVEHRTKRPLKVNQSAVLTLSDLHIAQLVNEKNNYFDLDVAEMRLEKIFNQFIEEIELRGIEDVHILLLGDLIHAQPLVTKKMDMKLSSALPEVQASIKCFEFLSTHIDRLVTRYNVSIAGVIGNESRFVSYLNPSNLQSEARNNMDVVIFEMLKQRYRDCSTVEFVNNGDELEDVVSISGANVLLTHGNSTSINHKDLDKSFINIKARLEPVYGEIDYMVLGHIHSTMLLDRVFRNSSLVGSNSYSNELGFAQSFVSQNMLIIDEDGVRAFSLKA